MYGFTVKMGLAAGKGYQRNLTPSIRIMLP
ncbi:MAG: hypothetical protein EWM72_02666 [Nitrospira sp.]|nr:MAG: hypothetical protein EWM72_02666 [Nitrospira sp.]